MKIETTVAGMRHRARMLRADGARVALVPTMGALHAGHLALVEAARRCADTVVVSIFVNPLQFGPQEDFNRYPRTMDADVSALDRSGVVCVFAPAVDEMYAPGDRTMVFPRPYAELYEGAVRPGHFAGVLTVVVKLFNIVQPDVAVFGRKDLQQLSLVRAMVDDLNVPLTVECVDTVREPGGLAMSSRNRYLREQDRARAATVYSALTAAKTAFQGGERDPAAIAAAGEAVLANDPEIGVNYLAVVDPDSFATPDQARPGDALVIAVRVGTTRLIDNIIL